MPIVLAASMPEKTDVPMSRRLICAAPWAKTSGTSPRMKAKEVIITERKAHAGAVRRRIQDGGAPVRAVPWANSTIRMPFLAARRDQHDQADLRIEVEAEAGNQHSGIGTKHPHDHGEQDRNRDDPALVETDEEQEREKHGHGQDRAGLTAGPRAPDKALPVHSKPYPGGRALSETSCMAASAAPDEPPGAGLPLMLVAR